MVVELFCFQLTYVQVCVPTQLYICIYMYVYSIVLFVHTYIKRLLLLLFRQYNNSNTKKDTYIYLDVLLVCAPAYNKNNSMLCYNAATISSEHHDQK